MPLRPPWAARGETIVFGEVCTGAGDDIQRATTILREHRALLDGMAHELIGRESLDAAALEVIFQVG